MAKVLVVYGSKMGGTAEIASWITDTVRSEGHVVVCADADEVHDVAGYDAVIAGSSLYGGHWRRPVIGVLKKVGRLHPSPPVWLFHSGPLGDEHAGEEQPIPGKVESLTGKLDVRGYTTFGGRLPEDPPGWIASKMAQNDKAGDWREIATVRAWARQVADSLAVAVEA
jgi:menaquinone-dependent protoporphyrinogen oxidase